MTTTNVTTPIKYPGSKVNLSELIVSLMPKHTCYVEVFGGSGAVLFNKPRSDVEIYNDINQDLVTMFRVIRDQPEVLADKLNLTLYSRAEYELFETMLNDRTYKDDVQRAIAVFVAYNQSYGGTRKKASWSFSKSSSEAPSYYKRIDELMNMSERLRGVQVECRGCLDVLRLYDSPETCFYLDPPYVTETRTKVIYSKEFTDLDHIELVHELLSCKGSVIVSGYDHKIYADLDKKLERVDVAVKMTMSHTAKRYQNSRDRVEVLWHTPLPKNTQLTFNF